jgi:hypothetical protein
LSAGCPRLAEPGHGSQYCITAVLTVGMCAVPARAFVRRDR